MAKKYDIVAIVGSYTKDGQEKKKYRNVGIVNDNNGKLSIRMETPIVLDDEGKVVQWFNLYEPQGSSQGEPSRCHQDDSDIPF